MRPIRIQRHHHRCLDTIPVLGCAPGLVAGARQRIFLYRPDDYLRCLVESWGIFADRRSGQWDSDGRMDRHNLPVGIANFPDSRHASQGFAPNDCHCPTLTWPGHPSRFCTSHGNRVRPDMGSVAYREWVPLRISVSAASHPSQIHVLLIVPIMVLEAVALLLLWRRGHSVLDLWLSGCGWCTAV